MNNEELTFTREELVILASTICDLARIGKVETRNGLTTSREYLTPFTCYCLSNILKKVAKELHWDYSSYHLVYLKLREGSNLGK